MEDDKNQFGYTPEELDSFKRRAERKKIEGKAAEIIPEKAIISDDILEWELKAPYDGDKKQVFTYDKSFERCELISKNHRQPYSHEVFGLIMNGLEGKLSGNEKIVFDDMPKSYGEWLGQAFLRENEKSLVVYYNPKLTWYKDVDKYGMLSYSGVKIFDVSGIPSLAFIPLDRFKPEFVREIYGREYSQLPQAIRERDNRAHVYLPPVGKIWPLGRGYFNNDYNVWGYYYINRASRWVAASAKIFHRK